MFQNILCDTRMLSPEHKATIEAGLWDTDETPLYVAALEGNADCFQVLRTLAELQTQCL